MNEISLKWFTKAGQKLLADDLSTGLIEGILEMLEVSS